MAQNSPCVLTLFVYIVCTRKHNHFMHTHRKRDRERRMGGIYKIKCNWLPKAIIILRGNEMISVVVTLNNNGYWANHIVYCTSFRKIPKKVLNFKGDRKNTKTFIINSNHKILICDKYIVSFHFSWLLVIFCQNVCKWEREKEINYFANGTVQIEKWFIISKIHDSKNI